MRIETKNAFTAFVVSIAAVVVCTASAKALAGETPSKRVLDNKAISSEAWKQKKAHEANAAKERAAWMEHDAKQKEADKVIRSECWDYNPETDDLSKLSGCGTKTQAKAEPAEQPLADLDKLSRAVAVAETSGCSDGTARGRNNCHGIMCWPNGKRTPCYYASHSASHAAFKKLWAKPTMPYRGRFPDIDLAVTYTGADNSATWLCNVYRSYYGIKINGIEECHSILKRKHPEQYEQHFIKNA